MLSRPSSLPHPITYLLLSGVGDRDVVETVMNHDRQFHELANATTELTVAVLALTIVLLMLSMLFLVVLFGLQVR